MLSACSSDDSVTASSTDPTTTEAPTASTTPVERYCASMRVVADFEASLRAAGEDARRVSDLYATADADHRIEDAYDSANASVPIGRPEIKVGLNYGELFTGRVASGFADGEPMAEANAPRSDVDWMRSQPLVDVYTQQNCRFTVYRESPAAGGG